MQLLRRYDLESELNGDRAALLGPPGGYSAPRARPRARIRDGRDRVHHGHAGREAAPPTGAAVLWHVADPCVSLSVRFESETGPVRPARSPSIPTIRSSAARPISTINRSKACCGWCSRRANFGPACRARLRRPTTRAHSSVTMHSTGWHEDDIDRLEFVSDYQIQGLQNHYHTYGLGVPLIAVRRSHDGQDPAEHFYPPNVCFPLTAFLRVERPAQVVGQTILLHAVTNACPTIPTRRRPTSCSSFTTRSIGNRSTSPAAACRWKPTSARRWRTSSISRSFKTAISIDAGPAAPRRRQKAARALHAGAVRLQKDAGRHGPRPVVEPHHLDGNVQRPAQRPAGPRPLPVLVLSVSDRPAVLDQRHADARRPGHDAPRSRPVAAIPGAG